MSSIGPNNVESGLIFAIDARNGKSYVSGSTTTSNLIRENNIDGTLFNGVGFDGNAWVCDGVNDRISIPLYDITSIQTQWTYSTWSYINNIQSYIWVYTDNAFFPIIGLLTLTDNKVRVRALQTQSTDGWEVETDSGISNGWNNIVVTKEINGIGANNYNCKIYINGEFVPQTLIRNNATQDWWVDKYTSGQLANDFNIGSLYRAPSQENYYQQTLSNLSVYNKVLSTDEIKQNYEEMKYRFR